MAGKLFCKHAFFVDLRYLIVSYQTYILIPLSSIKIPISTNRFEINHWFPSGEVPLPGFAGYGASKAALISFSGTIRQELSRWGVKVIVIQPGAFKTSENKGPFTPRTITIMMTISVHTNTACMLKL